MRSIVEGREIPMPMSMFHPTATTTTLIPTLPFTPPPPTTTPLPSNDSILDL